MPTLLCTFTHIQANMQFYSLVACGAGDITETRADAECGEASSELGIGTVFFVESAKVCLLVVKV